MLEPGGGLGAQPPLDILFHGLPIPTIMTKFLNYE
jgi:hypothetical protein